MERFKTLNNHCCKDIIRHACNGNFRAAYMKLYNCHNYLHDSVLIKLYDFLLDFAPLTLDVYKTLPLDVQSFFNSLWLLK